jgi:hypothetical protein
MGFKFVLILAVLFQCDALAQTVIKFTQRELAAGVTLMKPELNGLELNGQAGVFRPGPSLRAVGVDEILFDINFSGITELANIKFNHLKSRAPSVAFEDNSLVVSVPLEDQTRAAQSLLGAIHVKGVVLKVRLAWHARVDGSPELQVASTAISGSVTGTGVLRPAFMIALVKKLLLRALDGVASRIVSRPQVQESIGQALLGWAKLSTGETWHHIVPGTAVFYSEGAESGLSYQVQ